MILDGNVGKLRQMKNCSLKQFIAITERPGRTHSQCRLLGPTETHPPNNVLNIYGKKSLRKSNWKIKESKKLSESFYKYINNTINYSNSQC